MNRRDWLKTAGGLVVGFTLGGLPAFGQQAAPASPLSSDGRPLDPKEVDSFLAINPDSSVTVYTSKVDVGTGMRVAIAQMAARSSASIRRGSPSSTATPRAVRTREAPAAAPGSRAEARRFVRRRRPRGRRCSASARSRLKRPAADLTIVAGEVRPVAGGRGVRIGELVGGRRLALPVDAKAPLVPPATYTRVGQSPLRPDVPAKCTGTLPVHPGLHRAGHAARARHPAAGARRHARLGRRSVGRAASRRPRRASRELSRRRRDATNGRRSGPRAS